MRGYDNPVLKLNDQQLEYAFFDDGNGLKLVSKAIVVERGDFFCNLPSASTPHYSFDATSHHPSFLSSVFATPFPNPFHTRGNKNVTLSLFWNTIPVAGGLLPRFKSGSQSFAFGDYYHG